MKKRRIASLILTLALFVSTVFSGVAAQITAKADGGVTVVFHYLRDDGQYDQWNMWLWEDSGNCENDAGYAFTEVGDKGAMCSFKIKGGTQKLGFIVRTSDWTKDPDGDRFVEIGGVSQGTINVYLKSGSADFETVYGDDVVVSEKVVKAVVLETNYKEVVASMTKDVTEDMTSKIKLFSGDTEVAVESVKGEGQTAIITAKEELDPMGKYTVVYGENTGVAVTLPDYYSTKEFEDKYTYDGDDLGANWSKDKTVFKAWAPTAEKLEVALYEKGNEVDAYDTIEMTAGDKGVWTAEVTGDLNGVYYTYTAYFANDITYANIVDPYARTVGVNGDRGMVIDLDSTDPEGWDKDERRTLSSPTNHFIYELHIRDFSMHENSGISEANKGKYLAFTEKGTKTPNGTPTGIDHLADMGINAVHLLPTYDFGSVDETKLENNKYNWGYDPKNYNSPEGSYSTDPYNGEVRVNEYKQMVQAPHNEDIAVIIDVVYNHTQSNMYGFNMLVPGYFFRGSNASGCGNDVATERSMVQKFIVESCVYWAEEYHIDGLRFDLMAILDVNTMNAIRKALDEVDPNIFIYGEGWWSSEPKWTKEGVVPSLKANTAQLDRIAAFSDDIRDGIKGSVFNAAEKGYVNGNYGKRASVLFGVKGNQGWAPNPGQSINYAACHDNNTLWDTICTSNADDSEESRISQNKFAAAILQTSQGVPFTLSGEEFLRSKVNEDGTFNHNSYNAPDSVNAMDYSRLETYADVYEYYKGLIAFRKAHAGLRMNTKEDVNKYLAENTTASADAGIIAFKIEGAPGEVSDALYVIYNPYTETKTVNLPEGEWTICVNGEKAGTEALGTATGTVDVTALSCFALVKGTLAPEKLEDDFLPHAEQSGTDNEGTTDEPSTDAPTATNAPGTTTNAPAATNAPANNNDDGGAPIVPIVIGVVVVVAIIVIVKKKNS